MVAFTDDELKGMAVYSELVRAEVSGSYSPIGPNQRAELIRLTAEAFMVGERAPRTWFSLGTERRQMLRPNVPPDDLIARIILAKSLVGGMLPQGPRRNFEQVRSATDGPTFRYTLREMLYGPYVGDQIFHWEFNGYAFNLYKGTTQAEKISFFLQWDYEYYIVPHWVPAELRPFDGIDPNPFGDGFEPD